MIDINKYKTWDGIMIAHLENWMEFRWLCSYWKVGELILFYFPIYVCAILVFREMPNILNFHRFMYTIHTALNPSFCFCYRNKKKKFPVFLWLFFLRFSFFIEHQTLKLLYTFGKRIKKLYIYPSSPYKFILYVRYRRCLSHS